MRGQVELDRLADYAAGLLDGTPDGVGVAHLIESDPAWRRAYADLLAADRLVAADLSALGAVPEPMPADVAVRLTDRLDAEAEADRTVVSLDSRRRRKRWTAVAAAAAGVAVFGALGVPFLRSAMNDGSVSPTSVGGDRSALNQPAAPAPPGDSGLIIRASGMDYRRDTQWAAEGAPALGSAGQDRSQSSYKNAAAIPPELTRLSSEAARQDCLTAIIRVYGGRPQSVDYARFEGAAALIVVLVNEASRPVRLVAAGPDCGLNGNPYVRHTATIS